MVFSSYAALRLPKHFLRGTKVFPRLLHVALGPLQCMSYVDHNVGLSIYSRRASRRSKRHTQCCGGGLKPQAPCATSPARGAPERGLSACPPHWA